MYKRMLLSWDCRVYPKDVNEDVLDEDGTWTHNYYDESTESSSTSSTYENVEESIDDDDDEYTDDADDENVDIHVESKIDHVKKAKRRKKQDYKFRKRMGKCQLLCVESKCCCGKERSVEMESIEAWSESSFWIVLSD